MVPSNESSASRGQQSKKDSWKRSGKARPSNSGKHYASATSSHGMSNRVRLFLSVLALLACGAVWSFFLWKRAEKTPILSLIATQYIAPWAPNGWVREDVERLNSFSSGAFQHGEIKELNVKWKETLKSGLKKMVPGGPGGGLVLVNYRASVIYLSAHGVLNGDGEPCLLFSHAEPLNDKTWVSLLDVLSTVQETVEPKTRLLIVIDPGRQHPDVRTGVLSNQFVEQAIDVVKKFPRDHTAVLFSCGTSQEAWTAPELGCSFFGYLFHAGLDGHADDDGDGRLKVSELESFLNRSVDALVQSQRGRAQTPVVAWANSVASDGNHSNADKPDFEIALAGSRKPIKSGGYAKSNWNDAISKLRQVCDNYKRWSGAGSNQSSWAVDPIAKSAALSAITRAGQLLMSGTAYEAEFQAELTNASDAIANSKRLDWDTNQRRTGKSLAWIDRVQSRQSSMDTSPSRLTTSNASSINVAQVAKQEAAGTAANVAPSATSTETAPKAATPAVSKVDSGLLDFEAKARLWLSAIAKTAPAAEAKEKEPTPPIPSSRDQAVRFCFAWLLEDPQNFKQIKEALRLVPAIQSGADVSRDEALLKAIEFGWQTNPASDLHLRIWTEVLKQYQLLETGLAIQDPRAAHPLRAISKELDERFRTIRDWAHISETDIEADQHIFSTSETFASDCKQLGAQRDYLEQAWALNDDLAFEAPLLADWFLSASGPGYANDVSQIAKLWDASDALFLTLIDDAATKDIETRSKDIKQKKQVLDNLVRKYIDRLNDLVVNNPVDRPAVRGDLIALVRSRPPRWSDEYAKAFEDLNAAFDAGSKGFAREISQAVDISTYIKTLTRESKLPSDDRSAGELNSPVFELLTEIIGTLNEESSKAISTENRSIVGRELRSRWSSIPNQLQAVLDGHWKQLDSIESKVHDESTKSIRERSRKVRCIANLLPRPQDELRTILPQPDLQIAKQEFALWQSDRWLDDFWKTPEGSSTAGEASPFFGLAASDWAIAERIPKGPVASQRKRIDATIVKSKIWLDQWASLPAVPVGGEFEVRLPLSNAPSGTGWLGLRSKYSNTNLYQRLSDRGKSVERRIGFRTGGTATEERFDLAIASDTKAGDYLLEAWYRGHSKSADIRLQDPRSPFVLQWTSPPRVDTTVQVIGPAKKLQIVLVLDCSASFSEKSHKSACEAIKNAIRNLPRKQTELALLAFGHSVAYPSTSLQDVVNRKYDLSPVWKSNRDPWNDVEVLVRLQSLNVPAAIDTLEEKLESLEPHGSTPLYLSIIKAGEILSRSQDSPDVERRIVVLTDGMNDVNLYDRSDKVNPKPIDKARFTNDKDFDTNYENVRTSILGTKIRLDILGYEFQGSGQDLLEKLSKETGGKLLKPRNQSELAEHLDSLLFSEYFELRNTTSQERIGTKQRIDGPRVSVDQKSLGKSIELRVLGRDSDADIEAHAEILVRGNESLVVEYGHDGQGHGLLRFLGIPEEMKTQEFSRVKFFDQDYELRMLRNPTPNSSQIRVGFERMDPTQQSLRPDRMLVEVRGVQEQINALDGDIKKKRLGWTDVGGWEPARTAPILSIPYSSVPEGISRSNLEARIWIANKRPTSAGSMPLTGLQSYLMRHENKIEVSLDEPNRASNEFRIVMHQKLRNGEDFQMLHLYFDDKLDNGDPRPVVQSNHYFKDTEIIHEYAFEGSQVDLSRIRLIPSIVQASAVRDDQSTDSDGLWAVSRWMRIP